MKKFLRNRFVVRWLRPAFVTCSCSLILASAAFAQTSGGSPWENAVNVLMQAFTTTIARGLSLVSIVVAAQQARKHVERSRSHTHGKEKELPFRSEDGQWAVKRAINRIDSSGVRHVCAARKDLA